MQGAPVINGHHSVVDVHHSVVDAGYLLYHHSGHSIVDDKQFPLPHDRPYSCPLIYWSFQTVSLDMILKMEL